MSQLFTPTQAGPLRLANRIVIAPMCEYSADAGCATDWHMIHLGHLACPARRCCSSKRRRWSPAASRPAIWACGPMKPRPRWAAW